MFFEKSLKFYIALGIIIIVIVVIISKSFFMANLIYSGTLIYLVLFFFFNLLIFFFFSYFLLIYFLAVLGLGCCARAFSSCGEPGLLFVAVRRLLIAVASLVVERGL